jgi:hypothetical protein
VEILEKQIESRESGFTGEKNRKYEFMNIRLDEPLPPLAYFLVGAQRLYSSFILYY